MVETFAERGLGRKDKVSYRDCITHEALNLDSHRLRTIKALLDGNVAMDEIVHLKRNLSVASSVKTLKNKMVIRKLRVLIEDLPLESIEQARAFSRLLGLLLETACSPQGTEPRGTETVVPTI
jgi:hypothetical protein